MSDREKSILIAGYFGFGNTGDEAILAAMLHHLRKLSPKTRFILISGNPKETARNHAVSAILWTDISKILAAMQLVDIVLLGGGGLFHDYWRFDPEAMLTSNHSGLSFFSGIAEMAHVLKKPLMIYAVGVGPLFTDIGKEYTRHTFEQAEIITVRDEQSKTQLTELGIDPGRVTVTADPSFGFSPVVSTRNMKLYNGKHPLLGVALREWDMGVRSDVWGRQVAKALDIFIQKTSGSILFTPFQEINAPHLNDRLFSEVILSQMKCKDARILTGKLSTERMASVISQCDLLLGMRLHSHIFAINSGVPIVSLAYDPKIRNLMGRVGLQDFCFEMKEIVAKDLSEILIKTLEKKQSIQAQLLVQGKYLTTSAQNNARLAKTLLRKSIFQQKKDLPIGQDIEERLILSLAGITHVQKNQISRQHKSLTELNIFLKKRDETIKTQSELLDELIDKKKQQEQQIRELTDTLLSKGMDSSLLHSSEATLSKQLQAIHTSRYWKYLSIYWGSREWIERKYGRFKNALRNLVPYNLRRWVAQKRKKSGVSLEEASSTLEDYENIGFPAGSATYDVICFPIIDWDFRFQRPQQLIKQFASNGHRCFYISTSKNSSKNAFQLRTIHTHIHEVIFPGSAPLSIYSQKMRAKEEERLFKAIDDLKEKESIHEAVMLVDLPYWTPLVKRLKDKFNWKLIYDCMDDHSGFSTNSKQMLAQETGLIKSSDLVLVTSHLLKEKCSPLSKNLLSLPNATDYEHFSQFRMENPLTGIQHPIIGYYGAISEWFDCDLIKQTAINHPEWQFVLIGDMFGSNAEILKFLTNVHIIGEKSYQDLPAFLHQFDVACIPFKLNTLTKATNPVKFFEYLSAGKSVVSIMLPELAPYKGYYFPYTDANDFPLQISNALGKVSPEEIQSRQDLARNNSWVNRYNTLHKKVISLYPKTSIIITSCDNLEYLKLCLNSIFRNTLIQNVDIIIVDNGSREKTAKYLKSIQINSPNIKVIFNGENLGFAKAINIGIKETTGSDYVVFLNDDAMVTRGWLGKLIRALDEPGVKMSGPVTNNIGNEARIKTSYSNLEEMENFARDYCEKHTGQRFDIPMLAMFCVAMKIKLFNELGFLDEQFGIGMFEDDDFSLRIHNSGGRIVCCEDVFIHHWGGTTLNKMSSSAYNKLFEENRKKYEQKWGIKWHSHHGRED